MLEYVLVLLVPVVAILSYFLVPRIIKKGLFEGYSEVMEDIVSEQTQAELSRLAQGVVQAGVIRGAKAGMGTVRQNFNLTDVIGLGIMGYMKKMGLIDPSMMQPDVTARTNLAATAPVSENPLKIG